MTHAGRVLRAAIARQQQQHDREIRLERHTVCDFCMGAPTWYYRSAEIVLTMDGRVMLERDALRDNVVQQERDSGHPVQRFDSGWFACDDCKELIEERDGEQLIVRWRGNQDYKTLSVEYLDYAERQLFRVHELFMEHISAPLRLRELAGPPR